MGKLLRFYGYLFSTVLCLAMIGVSLVVLLSGSNTFTLEMIPWWTGRVLAKYMLCAGLAGLVITWTVASGRLAFLMVLWMGAVFGVLVYGFYLTGYKYDGWSDFTLALYATGAAFLALLAALTGLSARRERRRR